MEGVGRDKDTGGGVMVGGGERRRGCTPYTGVILKAGDTHMHTCKRAHGRIRIRSIVPLHVHTTASNHHIALLLIDRAVPLLMSKVRPSQISVSYLSPPTSLLPICLSHRLSKFQRAV